MNKLFHRLILCILLFSLAACSGSPPSVTSTASPAPIVVPTIFPTSTVVAPSSPLYQSVTLTYWSFNGGNSPASIITAQTPALTGSSDPRVIRFNHEMYALVQEEIAQFDLNPKELPADPTLPNSFLDVRFELLSPPGNLFSLKFTVTVYMKGAAHPFDYTRTVTYDLEKGEDVTIDSLFIPGADYLGLISAYCLGQLSASEIGQVLSAEGAQPAPENYRNWNVTAEGILITFDEYQVAPYAAGPQTVAVPYSELQSIVDPQGPLAGLLAK